MTKIRATTIGQFMPKIVTAMLNRKVKCPVCHEKFEKFWLDMFHLPSHYNWNGKIK